MAKQRLSKLQKRILEKCLNDLSICYRGAWEFYGKKFTENTKSKIFSTDCEEQELTRRLGKNYKTEFDIEEYQGEYMGKTWHGLRFTPKKEYCITNSEKAVISRSLKGLVNKGLLVQLSKWGPYNLTEAGYLKANNLCDGGTFISFKDYQEKLAEQKKAHEEAAKKITEDLIKIMANC